MRSTRAMVGRPHAGVVPTGGRVRISGGTMESEPPDDAITRHIDGLYEEIDELRKRLERHQRLCAQRHRDLRADLAVLRRVTVPKPGL